MTQQLLPDRWLPRDFPVLMEVARQMDEGARFVESGRIVRALGMDAGDVGQAFEALTPTYLDAKVQYAAGGVMYHAVAKRLTERGRRATGLWPNQDDQAGALIDLLTQAAEHVEDEDDAGALRKAGRMLRGVPSAVVADVTAALIRQQTGI